MPRLVVTEHLCLELLAGAREVGLEILALLLAEVGLLLAPGEGRGQLLVLALQLLRPPPALKDLLLLGQPRKGLKTKINPQGFFKVMRQNVA